MNSKSKPKKSKIKGFLIAFLVFVLIKVFGGYILTIFDNSNDHDRSIQSVYDSIDVTRKDLPIVIDEFTTLEAIDFDGSTIFLNYRLKLSGLNDSEKNLFESEVQSENAKIACETPDIVKGLNMGIDYNYNYYDLDNVKVGNYVVTREFCTTFD